MVLNCGSVSSFHISVLLDRASCSLSHFSSASFFACISVCDIVLILLPGGSAATASAIAFCNCFSFSLGLKLFIDKVPGPYVLLETANSAALFASFLISGMLRVANALIGMFTLVIPPPGGPGVGMFTIVIPPPGGPGVGMFTIVGPPLCDPGGVGGNPGPEVLNLLTSPGPNPFISGISVAVSFLLFTATIVDPVFIAFCIVVREGSARVPVSLVYPNVVTDAFLF